MKNKKNHIFLLCEKCKNNGRCKKQKQIPTFCLKGCIIEEKAAKDNKPQTIHELLVRKYGEDKLKSNALTLLDDYYKRRCTFENVLHESLRDRQDPKFEEYNKAYGLGRAAMCLDNSNYQEWAILCAALAALIEKLEGEK